MNASFAQTNMPIAQKIAVGFLLIFGLLTLFMSSSVIFDLFGIREREGNYVPFIVCANFVAGILYIISVWGFIKHYKFTTYTLSAAALILLGAFAGLVIYINQGGIYETKTVFAMIFRIAITIGFTLFSLKFNERRNQQ